MVDYNIAYYGRLNLNFGPPILSGPVGAGFNMLTRLDVKSGKTTDLFIGPACTVQEHCHIPSPQAGS